MNSKGPLFASIATLALAVPVWAEKPNLNPQKLSDIATHVVRGKATAIYQRTEENGSWKYSRYLVEIRVEECEKGDGIEKGDLVYARYWHRKWIGVGQMPASTTGHRGLPEVGDSLRAYLARNADDGFSTENDDGGFNVIGANGFEKLKQGDEAESDNAGQDTGGNG